MNNSKYWEKRKAQNLLNAEKKGLQYERNLGNSYLQSAKQIELEINNIYAKYFGDGKVDYNIIQQKLTKSQMNEFRKQLNDKLNYAVKNGFDTSYINNLKRKINGTYRITRLEELQDNIEFELQKLKGKEHKGLTSLLTEQYKDGYYRTAYETFKEMGVGGSFTMLNKKAIQTALNTKWAGDNYSGRIWKNKQLLEYTLRNEIPKNIILGKGPGELAKVISDTLSVDFGKSQRLARTELNKIYNSATEMSYKSTGVSKKYRYVATLDDKTSHVCQELDGMVFDVSEAKVGVNYPPMHPNCRSTTIAEIDDNEYSERLAKGEEGYYKMPANITYEMWFDKYVNKSGFQQNTTTSEAQIQKERNNLKKLKEKI